MIVVCYTPTDRNLFAGIRVVRFSDDTAHQVEPYCESLGQGTTALVVDPKTAEPMAELLRMGTDQLTALHNALAGPDEAPVGKPRVRDDGVRRLYNRIAALAKGQAPLVWNPQPTFTGRDKHDAEMIANADCFVVTVFRGHPKGHDRHDAKTLDNARELAVSLYEDRPVAIYAVRGNRQIHVENYPSTATHKQEKTTVPKQAKIGEFKQVNPTTNLGKIVQVFLDFDDLKIADIAAQVGLAEDKVTTNLRAARGNNGIDHTIDKETGVVSLVLPEGVVLSGVLASTNAKTERKAREPKFGQFAQAREGSRLAKMISASPANAEAIGGLHGMTGDEVIGHLKRARVSHGIDHAVAEDGTVTITAHGMPADTVLIKPAAEPRVARDPNAVRAPRTDKVLEAAKQGVMPTPPDFSAATHKGWLKKHAELVALANDRNVDGLRAFKINPISTSPRALDRYRNAAIAAIEAGQPQAQAAE